MSFLKQYDETEFYSPKEVSFEMGIVDYLANGKAYVKINGSTQPVRRGAFIPKNQTVNPGEKVLVSFIGGAWWIINNY